MEEYNIYLFLKGKSKDRIRAVFNEYVYSNLGDELMYYRSDDSKGSIGIQAPEWISISRLDDVVDFGIGNSSIYMSSYYKVEHDFFTKLILAFTFDNNTILGFSVETSDIGDTECKELAIQLRDKYRADAVVVFVEEPPPVSEKDYLSKAEKMAFFSNM